MTREEPALPALNERLRDDYVADCQRGVDRWNQVIRKHGIDAEPAAAPPGLPPRHRDLRRDARLARTAAIVSQAEWDARRARVAPDATPTRRSSRA